MPSPEVIADILSETKGVIFSFNLTVLKLNTVGTGLFICPQGLT